MSIRRALPLIVVLGAFLIIMLLLATSAEGHDPELCDETTQQLQELVDYEFFSGFVVSQLQEIIPIWQAACRIDPPREEHPTHSGSPSYTGGAERWRALVSAYFGVSDIETALCIINYETGFTGDPNSKNPYSSAAGLFQFLRSTWDNMVPSSVTGGSYASGQVYQPEANIRSAAWLQQDAGWRQWSPWNRGLCRGL